VTVDPIAQLFERLDAWRHLPDYQLERRADVFFSLYLSQALEAKLGFPISPELAPEFPVRIGTIYRDTPTNSSKKVDYLAMSADGRRPILVELKTDRASRSVVQDEYLLRARAVGLPALLEGLLDIFRATSAKQKYFYLLSQLQQMGLLEIPSALTQIMTGPSLRGVTAASRGLRVVSSALAPPEIVYVQPHGDGPGVLGFHLFADVVDRHGDPVSHRFAASLREWADVKA
jgi:hypothetical protein